MKYSIIVAVYNGEKYLERFFDSIISQSCNFLTNIEIIAVDDGSRDASKDIIASYIDRYPDNIQYFYKENGGQGSARNFGLEHVTGEWVSFIDQDDFIDKNYYKELDAFIYKKMTNSTIAVVWAKHIYFLESSQQKSDSHLLKHCFARGAATYNISMNPDHFQPFTSSAVISAALIKKHNLSFDERVFPGSEDLRFFIDLFAAEPSCTVGFVPTAKFYRLRPAAKDSCLDTSWNSIRKHTDVLLYGFLEPLRKLAGETKVSQIIKNLVLYEISSHIRHYRNNAADFLSHSQRGKYLETLKEIVSYFCVDDINRFIKFQGSHLLHKDHVAILRFYFGKEKLSPNAYFISYDDRQKLLSIAIYTQSGNTINFTSNKKRAAITHSKTLPVNFMGRKVAEYHITWVSYDFTSNIKLEVDGATENISFHGREYTELHSGLAFQLKKAQPKNLPWKNKILRAIMKSPAIRFTFKNCWLFLDRDFVADDNAEHFYRWVREHDPNRPIRFLLNKTSPDWQRLHDEGFNLVQFGSLWHYILLATCEWFISSHANGIMFRPFFTKYYGDIKRFKFCFLQHGVTKDDLSTGLNRWPIDMFITSAEAEYTSVAYEYPYKLTAKEVCNTGFPRHDALLKQASGEKHNKYIIIAPTWRKYLSGGVEHTKTFKQKRSQDFIKSSFFSKWHAILHDKRLTQCAMENGYQLFFLPHPDIFIYKDDFIDGGEIATVSNNARFQDTLCNGALLLTDYSSIAFEFALLKQPILYYQFDKDEFFENHTYSRGYFDYERDGFGDVFQSHEEIIRKSIAYIESGCKIEEKYSKRSGNFFSHWDRNNCQRVYDALIKANSRYIP